MKIAFSLIAIFLFTITSSAPSLTISKNEYEKVFQFAVEKTNAAYPVIFKVTTDFIEKGKRIRTVTDLTESAAEFPYGTLDIGRVSMIVRFAKHRQLVTLECIAVN